MISSTRRRCSTSSLQRRAVAQKLPEKAAAHLQRATGQNVVERGHAAKQRQVLEGAGNAAVRSGVGAHAFADLPFERDATGLRLIKTVDHIEHRGLAGAVRTDDGADFALADIERNAGQRAHAAEREGNILDGEQHLAASRLARRRRSHAARSIFAGRVG